jgi:hypothetical protein
MISIAYLAPFNLCSIRFWSVPRKPIDNHLPFSRPEGSANDSNSNLDLPLALSALSGPTLFPVYKHALNQLSLSTTG